MIAIFAPVGISYIYDINMPTKKHIIEIIKEFITTALKLLKTLIDVSVGKIIRLDINKEPIVLIPKTMISEVKNAIIILYKFTLIPVALEKFSSKVIANILL